MQFNICPWPECGTIELTLSDTPLVLGLAAVALTIYGFYNNYRNGMPLP